MAGTGRGNTLRSLQTLYREGSVGNLSDGELLERFTARRGDSAEQAFAALVGRHGPLVLRVCRRVLGNAHDAEDAFQATFIVLANRAKAVRRRESLACWLHGVALRVAWSARTVAARRQVHERKTAEAAARSESWLEPEGRGDSEEAIHEELGRLPERYRAAILLCDLEGLTQEQAAARLGWPIGSVKSRLSRGRERLRRRLRCRGLAPSVGAPWVAGGLASPSVGLSDAAVRGALGATRRIGLVKIVSEVGPAAQLANKVLRTMTMAHLKAVAGVFAVGVLAAGAGVFAQQGAVEARPGVPMVRYEIRVGRAGAVAGPPVIVEAVEGDDVRVETSYGVVIIRPSATRPAPAGAPSAAKEDSVGRASSPVAGAPRAKPGMAMNMMMGQQLGKDMMPGRMGGPSGAGHASSAGPGSLAPLGEPGMGMEMGRGRMPGMMGGPSGLEPSDSPITQERRLKALEEKIDRILNALEKSKLLPADSSPST